MKNSIASNVSIYIKASPFSDVEKGVVGQSFSL
jgi:hypothetical protein